MENTSLVRFQEPPMIASGNTIQEEEHVEIAEDKDTLPKQISEASIDKQIVDIKLTRKKKSQIKIKKRVPIGRPWE